MAKRFTDNEKWKKQFFKSLSTVNKLFFLYILDECDNAGVWHVEPEIAELRIGEKINIELAKRELGKHVHEFDNCEKWFIPSFIDFQYGSLNPNVNAHKSVIDKLSKKKLNKVYEQLINCSSTDLYKYMDKDKDKKKKFAEFVEMTEAEHNKLLLKYGKEYTEKMIDKLSNYKGSNDKKYKSDYRAILSWVADSIMGDSQKGIKELET